MIKANLNLHNVQNISCKSEHFLNYGSGKKINDHTLCTLAPLWKGFSPLFEQTWIQRLIIIGLQVPENNILKDFFNIHVHVKMVFPILVQSNLRGPSPEQTRICTMSGSFHINLSFCGLVVLEIKSLNDPILILVIFVITSPLKRTWPYIWTIFNSP
jgi:hypothetical protein